MNLSQLLSALLNSSISDKNSIQYNTCSGIIFLYLAIEDENLDVELAFN